MTDSKIKFVHRLEAWGSDGQRYSWSTECDEDDPTPQERINADLKRMLDTLSRHKGMEFRDLKYETIRFDPEEVTRHLNGQQ